MRFTMALPGNRRFQAKYGRLLGCSAAEASSTAVWQHSQFRNRGLWGIFSQDLSRAGVPSWGRALVLAGFVNLAGHHRVVPRTVGLSRLNNISCGEYAQPRWKARTAL